MHMLRAMEAMEGSGECTRQTRLKGMTQEENERPQIDCVLEKRSTDDPQQSESSANMEEGGNTTICQTTFLKGRVPTLETSPFDIPQGDQQGEGSLTDPLDHLKDGKQSQKSPATNPLDLLTQAEPTAPVSS